MIPVFLNKTQSAGESELALKHYTSVCESLILPIYSSSLAQFRLDLRADTTSAIKALSNPRRGTSFLDASPVFEVLVALAALPILSVPLPFPFAPAPALVVALTHQSRKGHIRLRRTPRKQTS